MSCFVSKTDRKLSSYSLSITGSHQDCWGFSWEGRGGQKESVLDFFFFFFMFYVQFACSLKLRSWFGWRKARVLQEIPPIYDSHYLTINPYYLKLIKRYIFWTLNILNAWPSETKTSLNTISGNKGWIWIIKWNKIMQFGQILC